jgi:hypothetical protein
MTMNRARALTLGSLVAAGVLLSACGGHATGTAAPAVSTSATSSTTATSAGAAGVVHTTSSSESIGGDQDCGKVDTFNGQVDLIADATPAGTVGCTEAIDVMTEYFQQAPTKAEGTADALTVEGWSCLADTGAQGTGAVGCEKDGLSMHTQP